MTNEPEMIVPTDEQVDRAAMCIAASDRRVVVGISPYDRERARHTLAVMLNYGVVVPQAAEPEKHEMHTLGAAAVDGVDVEYDTAPVRDTAKANGQRCPGCDALPGEQHTSKTHSAMATCLSWETEAKRERATDGDAHKRMRVALEAIRVGARAVKGLEAIVAEHPDRVGALSWYEVEKLCNKGLGE